MVSPERLAFKTQAYINAPIVAIATDLAAVTIENCFGTSLRKGIHTGRLKLVENKKIIDAKTTLPPKYSKRTEFDKRESESGEQFDEVLLTHPEGTLVLWLSPNKGPLDYQEGRVRVGIKTVANNEVDLIYYGIRVRGEINYDQFRNFGAQLSEFAEGDFDLGRTENLRDQVFIIPPDNIDEKTPWKFLEKMEPALKGGWVAIGDSWVDQHFEKILAETMQIAPTLFDQIQTARNRQDFIRIGAMGEEFMMAKGYALRGSGCGRLNSEIQSYTRINFLVSGGQIAGFGSEKMHFVKRCGQCSKPIYSYIGKGYKCTCGGVYRGC